MSDINEMNVGPRWYVAHTYSGYENKVKASLEKIIENRGLGHLIFDICIPTEIVIIDGPFKGFTATVQMVSDDLETITALVKKGRRDMFVEIKASAVELA